MNELEKSKDIIVIFKSIANIDEVEKLIKIYEGMVLKFLINDFESVLVKLGKFVENFYQILDYLVRNTKASSPDLTKIRERLEKAVNNQVISKYVKSLVADSLYIAYRFRNSRDGAHISDIIANKIDAKYVISTAKWCLSEMVRLYSPLNSDQNLELINSINSEPIPFIEKFDNKNFVSLDLSAANEILTLLLFEENGMTDINTLKSSIKLHTNSNINTSLRRLEEKRYVIRNNEKIYITTKGRNMIEKVLAKYS